MFRRIAFAVGLYAASLAAAELASAPAARAGEVTAFVAGIDDLPLMAGLTSVPGTGLVFDKASGRIVEAYAEGAVGRDQVAAFYTATLPQLGWRARESNVFIREGERLSIVFLGGNGDLIVRFTLEPD